MDSQFEELPANSLCSPSRIESGHLANERGVTAQLPPARPRAPAPEEAKARAVPPQDRGRLDQGDSRAPRHRGDRLCPMSHRCVVEKLEKRTRLPWSRHFAATSCRRSISFSATSDRRERTSPASRRSRTKIIVARYQQDEGAADGRCSRRESRTGKVASTGVATSSACVSRSARRNQ